MARRRFVQIDGKLIEVTQDYQAPVDTRRTDSALWGDRSYDGLRASDGTDISSRTKHREYMKANGLVTFDDYAQTFAKEQERRDAYHSGRQGSVSRADFERAIAKLTGY